MTCIDLIIKDRRYLSPRPLLLNGPWLPRFHSCPLDLSKFFAEITYNYVCARWECFLVTLASFLMTSFDLIVNPIFR